MTALLALAFAAGMIAPVNPCGFALLPAWIAQTIGDARTRPLALRLAHGLRAGLALSLGFAGTLAAFGLIVSAGARTLISAAPWLGMATGVILLLLGLAMLTGLTPRLRLPAWATKPRTQEAAGAGHKTGRMVAFGIGYAAASLGCTLGVLLAVIAQAQAVASYAGLLAVFAAYAAGSATVLMLVSAGTAIAGAALGRRITGLAKHSNRITAFILTITGAYLSWYWYPAATGGTAQANSLAVWSAAASAWISDNSTLIAALAAAVVLASALAVLNRRRRLRIRQGTPPTGEGPGQSRARLLHTNSGQQLDRGPARHDPVAGRGLPKSKGEREPCPSSGKRGARLSGQVGTAASGRKSIRAEGFGQSVRSPLYRPPQ